MGRKMVALNKNYYGTGLAIFIFSLCFVNVWSSFFNNFVISLAQLFLLVLCLPLFKLYFDEIKVWLFLAALLAISMTYSNLSVDAEYTAEIKWFRAFGMLMQVLFLSTCYVVMRHESNAFEKVILAYLLSLCIYSVVLLCFWFSLAEPEKYDWFHDVPLFAHVRNMAMFVSVFCLFSLCVFSIVD